MTGKTVSQYGSDEIAANDTMIAGVGKTYTNMQVATTVTFTVALFQVILWSYFKEECYCCLLCFNSC